MPPSKSDIPIWIWAGAAALVLVTLYSTWNAQRMQREIQAANERAALILQQRRELQAQLDAERITAAILVDPASVKIALASPDSQTPQLEVKIALASPDSQTPQLEAKWHSQLGIVLTGQKIAAPSGNRVLQLWLIPKASAGKPVSSLTVRPDADGKFVLLVSNPPGIMSQTKALAITEEPEGGSAQPTTPIRWVGGVS